MMEAEKKGVVWILGAGFSRPLGGPLLHDLISEATLGEIEGTAGDDRYRRVLFMYNVGRREEGEKMDALWTNPEEMLETLAVVTVGLPSVRRARVLNYLNRHEFWGPKVGGVDELLEMNGYSRAFVAQACAAFSRDVSTSVVAESERWSPFVQWAGALTGDDSVVTFNYDVVPDLLSGRPIPAIGGTEFFSPVEPEFQDKMADPAKMKQVGLMHMHGSLRFEMRMVENERRVIWLREMSTDPVLGMPGPTKKQLSLETLEPIWKVARWRIKTGRALVFLGYRFPETDNYAKQQLLGAIRENRDALVHVVLGTESDSDVRRLREMLSWAGVTQDRLVEHHMWCEDFLLSFEREGLFPT